METLSRKDLDRFFSKMKMVESGCIEWQGTLLSHGYGQFRLNGKGILAHRLSYFIAYGSLTDGLTIDHLCNNRCCVNPFHLREVTHRENNIAEHSNGGAKQNRLKTHCKFGHEFTPENTYIGKLRSGGLNRKCRKCDAERHKNNRKDINDGP
jgi:hypothetical protein